jgi:hypothetical protein
VQPINQPIDLSAVALENAMESFVAIEPSAQGTVHIVGALPNVSRCLRGLGDLPQDGGRFHKSLRIRGWTFARKLGELVTQTLSFIKVHHCPQPAPGQPRASSHPDQGGSHNVNRGI